MSVSRSFRRRAFDEPQPIEPVTEGRTWAIIIAICAIAVLGNVGAFVWLVTR